MSVRPSEIETASEAQQIAETMSAKEFFLAGEEKLIDEWADKSVNLFRYSFIHVGSQAMS